MAEIKIGWMALVNLLGVGLWGAAVYENFEVIKASVLFGLAVIFLLVRIWLSYQKGRAQKIENDKEQFKLDCEKYTHRQKQRNEAVKPKR